MSKFIRTEDNVLLNSEHVTEIKVIRAAPYQIVEARMVADIPDGTDVFLVVAIGGDDQWTLHISTSESEAQAWLNELAVTISV